MITRIKICGITRQEDADVAIAAGVDALGFNFVPGSPRQVGVPRARTIAEAVGDAASRVGLFVDASAEVVRAVLDAVPIDLLQFHGAESGPWCRQFGVPYLKAVRVRGPLDVAALEAEYADACALLLDAYLPDQAGGTGTRFDWEHWPVQSGIPLIVAGGLTPDNVGEAVARLSPWGVDVAGGVEGAVKGEKDRDRIRRFVTEVHRARG